MSQGSVQGKDTMVVTIEKCIPNLGVADAAKAIEYYTKKLGFALDWDDAVVGHSKVMYACLSRGECTLCISEHPGERGASSAWAYVSDARALHRELEAAGARVREPEEMSWGEIELAVEDLDGNKICFTQRAPRKSQ